MYYYIGIVTGAVVLLISLLFLGFGKHVYVNAHTGEVIDFSLPILGRIKTRSPLIFFAGVGFALIIACSKMAPALDLIVVDGQVDSQTPVTVYFVAVPDGQYHQQVSGPLHTSIPKLGNSQYRAEFVVGDKLVDDKPLTVVKGHADLAAFSNSGAVANGGVNLIPQDKVGDAEAKAFLNK
ncbi:MAG TPA: hypothetical protein VKF41_02520 [Bryobacteraceae bacterium]|nr:hypothetical protein [Bryobacteraceae bacterium]